MSSELNWVSNGLQVGATVHTSLDLFQAVPGTSSRITARGLQVAATVHLRRAKLAFKSILLDCR